MDLKQMEYFITIADAGSISSAAKLLHMSQPPLSIQIKNLEEELGTTLFLRDSRHITLTESGKIFYKRAQGILALCKATTDEISDINKKRAFHIGITPTTVSFFLPYLKELQKKYPSLHFEIYDDDTFTLVDLLKNGAIEAACIRTPVTLGNIQSISLKKEKMIAVSSVSLKNTITLKELATRPLIVYRRYYSFILKAFSNLNIEPDVFSVCNDGRTSVALLDQTKACAILPESMVPLCKDKYVSYIDEPALETEILFAFQHNVHSQFVKELIQIIKKKENDYDTNK